MGVGTVRGISVVELSLYLYTNIQSKESMKLVVMNSGEITDALLATHGFAGYPVTILVQFL